MLKTFATKDEIDEALRGSAIETKDGKFLVEEPDDNSALEGALAKARTDKEATERLNKKLADELKKIETKNKAAESGISAEKIAEIEKQIQDRLTEEYRPRLEQNESLAKQVRELTLDTQVKAQAAKLGVIGSEIPKWWKLHGENFDLTTDGKPIVKGQEGVSMEQYIGTTLKKDTPYLYEGTKATGSGAPGSGPTPTPGLTTGDDILKNPAYALQQARAAGKTE